MRRPKYRKHVGRDRAFVEVEGKRRYLPGPYKSPESLAAYRAIILRLKQFDEGPERQLAGVADVAERFIAWANDTYPPGNKSEASNCRAAVSHLVMLHGAIAVAGYGPLKLKELQQRLAKQKKSRNYINAVCSRVKRMFKWAVSEELVPASVYHALTTVPGLRKGRSPAIETNPRQPVAAEHVLAILPELSRTVQAMVMLQWLTGARSQSICLARPEQFDTSVDPWEWRPRHKTEHHDHELVLFIGPKAQKILTPLLKGRKAKDFLFQPKHLNGKRARGYRSFYDSTSYLRAITRAINRLNKHREENESPPLPLWTPHQLRHARGTLVRAEYGLEAAQATLGHLRIDTTQIYAHKQIELARQVALAMG